MELNCETVLIVLEYVIAQRLAMPHPPERNGATEQETCKFWKALAVCFTPVYCRRNCG